MKVVYTVKQIPKAEEETNDTLKYRWGWIQSIAFERKVALRHRSKIKDIGPYFCFVIIFKK